MYSVEKAYTFTNLFLATFGQLVLFISVNIFSSVACEFLSLFRRGAGISLALRDCVQRRFNLNQRGLGLLLGTKSRSNNLMNKLTTLTFAVAGILLALSHSAGAIPIRNVPDVGSSSLLLGVSLAGIAAVRTFLSKK